MTTKPVKTPGKLLKPTNAHPKLKGAAPVNIKKPAAPNPALERKLTQAAAENERLQKLAEKLQFDLKRLCTEASLKDQENDRVLQHALLTKNQLVDQKNITLLLEKAAATQRAQQATEQTKLFQNIRSLMLTSKAKRISSTQTDEWNEKGRMNEAATQTMEELTKENAERLLRDSDPLLTAFIAELEREKIAAQNDLKFSLYYMEQRMKDDVIFQLRNAQEANDSRMEQILQNHSDQLRMMQNDHVTEKERLEARIEEMMKEIELLRETNDVMTQKVDESQEKLKEQSTKLGKAEAQAGIARAELDKLREFKRNVIHDVQRVGEMRSELNTFKDINDIILKEFAKLEEERDGLIAELERGIRSLGGLNGTRNESLNSKVLRLKELVKMKA